MPYEKRVGERIELGDMPVRWSRVPGTPKPKGPPRKRDRQHDVDHTEVYFRDISASGAGMVAPADDSITTGTILAVRVGPENSFVGRVKRVMPPRTTPGASTAWRSRTRPRASATGCTASWTCAAATSSPKATGDRRSERRRCSPCACSPPTPKPPCAQAFGGRSCSRSASFRSAPYTAWRSPRVRSMTSSVLRRASSSSPVLRNSRCSS